MILTVTLNPALDKTLTVKQLKLGESNPILDFRFDPGGKGINVSRVIKELKGETLALGFSGGDSGDFIKTALDKQGVKNDFVPIAQNTRTNVTLVDLALPPATEFNSPGPQVSEKELQELEAKILNYLPQASLVVFAGSLPPGLPQDCYQRLIRLVEKNGKKAVLDSRGKPLQEGIKETPYLIKPNRLEAENLLNRKLDSLPQVIRAGQDLLKMGIRMVVISLGQEGAILITGQEILQAVPPPVKVGSGVGAGDSMVAGFCLGIEKNLELKEIFKLATAASAATCMAPGTQLAKAHDIFALLNQVTITKL